MTTAYTSLLGLALPVTGELSGTWGDTVNDYITQYLDASVAGTQTISGSQTAVTLSKTTNAALTQAGTGATGSSQYSVINCTGNPASMLTVTVPAASKTYVVVNATSTNQDVKIVGAGPTTGVTLVAGEKAIIAWNGSDFIKVASSAVDGVSTISFGSTGLTPSTATSGAVTVAGTLAAGSGGTGQSTYTSGDLLYATGATALSKLGIGTNGQILTSTGTAPQWSTLSGVAVTTFSAGTTGFTPNTPTSGAITLGGTLATTNGGTGLTSFTANRVFYASSTSAVGQSANLTFDGTTLTANALTTTSTVTINGGTANGVAYLNGSKVLTTGSALVFDGTTFGLISAGLNTQNGTSDVVNPITASTNQIRMGASGFVSFRLGTAYDFNIDSYNFASPINLYNVTQAGTHKWSVAGSEQMRLTSTGLGIGTSSPAYKLDVSSGATATSALMASTATTAYDPTTSAAVLNARLALKGGSATNSYTAIRFTHSGSFENFFGAVQNSGGVGQFVWGGYNGSAYGEWMRLDSSGNLGLGVTPSAWGASFRALDVQGRSAFASGAVTQPLVAYNAFNNGTNWIYKNSVAASFTEQVAGEHRWFTAPSGTAGNTISFTQAMTLDASGRLLLGSTTNSANEVLQIDGNGVGSTIYTALFTNRNSSTSVYNVIRWTQGASGSAIGYIGTGGSAASNAAFQNTFVVGTQNATALVFNTNDTERARITSVGNVSIGGTADRGTTVGTNAIQIFNGTAPAGTLTNGVSLYSQSGDLRFMDAAGNAYQVGFRNVPRSGSAKTTSYTLATTDVGEYIEVGSGGSITIPDATFATGDVVSIFNNTTGNITITCTITTAYIAGTDSDKATMTLATRGVATILFISGTVCVVSGNVT